MPKNVVTPAETQPRFWRQLGGWLAGILGAVIAGLAVNELIKGCPGLHSASSREEVCRIITEHDDEFITTGNGTGIEASVGRWHSALKELAGTLERFEDADPVLVTLARSKATMLHERAEKFRKGDGETPARKISEHNDTLFVVGQIRDRFCVK